MSFLGITWQQTNRAGVAIAVVASFILLNGAYSGYKTLTNKAEQQHAALSQINRWKTEYELLKPVQARWNQTLAPTNEITDLYHIYNALKLASHGLHTDQERLLVEKIEPIVLNGVPLYATRVCLKTAAENGLAVYAPNFSPNLLDGLEQLADRHDVEIQNIVLTTENGMPKAIMDFCLIFRS